ncbi:MAG: UDP-N-acetylmuramoyl-L-alanyl-D-glutamate--2,6-diaminopimelate ligase [Zoogloeaceae bacterium]|jgi:UDP-N-acetylmuramyl-tripeptide synthetase|nr:UDP-N-acetylmuramoyl-L-alanyl-D-glutamate--2,6-diaminopimelate ligase [Zoogloeaceae bacterium]
MTTAIKTLLRQLAIPLSGATDDSRQARPGDLFLAYADAIADRRRYIPDALAKGAAAVFWQAGGDFVWSPDWQVPNLCVDNLRALAGPLAHELAGRPSEQLALLAITGTNGKTTISQWLAQAHPEPCAAIGTLGAGFAGAMIPTGFTTPEAPALVRLLADELAQGARACALEASSIGIEEGRLNGLRVDTAIFTNLTRDHLDYHGTQDAYAAAKEKLFLWPRLRLAVLNLDDPFGLRLARASTAHKLIGYSLTGSNALPAVLRAENLNVTASGQAFQLVTPKGRVWLETPLLGAYNVANLLAVAAVLQDRGMTLADLAERLAALTPPAGRMERYGGQQAPLAVVDYAHTPDALENALAALAPVAQARGGKLICVFGCGGDRDKGKRPLMGRVAVHQADEVWLTSDNPRSEDPLAILADIRAGIASNAAVRVEADRALSIAGAIAEADRADVLLIAGKGHEPVQEIAGARHPFLDAEHIERALARRLQTEETSCAGT